MVFVNGYILFSLFTVLGFFYGLLLFLSDYEENKCEMTYMFQYPQFVRISMDVDKHFKKYGLYSYSEGKFTEKARKMHFTGIPVLFIPGNAGSYKQVRSLASVALRKALNSRPGFHFDYFTINFNEELSALNGLQLYDQVVYLEHSIYRILELYALNKNEPTSIILIGHSMGGIVAECFVSWLAPNNNVVSLVITLASPHKRPPLFFDVNLHDFYKNIDTWNNNMNVTFVTVFGGYNDFLVATHLTTSKHLNVVTTHIPKMWLSTDHLCILWCKQLMLVLNRALFDSVDMKTKQLSQDKDYVTSVFKHHLLHNSGIKIHLRNQYDLITPIDDTGNWIEYLPRQYSVELTEGTKQTQWYMVRLIKERLHEMLTILALNLQVTNWIYACSAYMIRGHSRVCVDAMHLSHLSQIVPSRKYKRRFLNINLHDLSDNFTHVVVKILPTSNFVTLYVDVHSDAERKLTVDLPDWSLQKKVIIDETLENALYYELHFPKLSGIIKSYQLFVEPKKCKKENHHATGTLTVPWSNLDYHVIFTEKENKPMNLRLYSSKPSMMVNSSVFVKLVLDPNCRYSISVKLAVPSIFGQFARFCSPLIFANVVVVILLSLQSQLNNIETNGGYSLFFTALMDTKPYKIAILTLILSSSVISKLLPNSDVQILEEEGVGFFLTVCLYILSVGIVWISTMILAVSIFCFQSTIYTITLKIVSKSITGTPTRHDWLLKILEKFPSVLALSLIIINVSTCGGVALCFGLIFYYLKLTLMAQNVVENLLKKLIKELVKKLKLRPQSQRKVERSILRNIQGNNESDNVQSTSHQEDDSGNLEDPGTSQNEASVTETKEDTSTSKTSDIQTEESTNDILNANLDEPQGDIQTEESTNDILNANLDEPQGESSQSEDHTSLYAVLLEITENNELYFHFTIFCLWFLVTCINIPVVLAWAHNFMYNPKVDNDPSFLPGLVLCTCAIPLWQLELPKINKKWYKELSYIIYIFAIFCFSYGVLSVYRLNYVLSIIIILITLHQLIAPNKIDVPRNDNSEFDDTYQNLKVKLE